MPLFSCRSLRIVVVIVIGLLALSPADSFAFKQKEGQNLLDELAFGKPELWTTTQMASLEELQGLVATGLTSDWNAFAQAQDNQWILIMDRVTGRPSLMEGKGIPWIPGSANGLTGTDLGLSANTQGMDVPVEMVASKAIEFMKAYPNLFGVDASQLTLDLYGSGPVLDYLYFLHFGIRHGGLPVEGAYIVFRLNSGNMVQMGQELIEPATLARLNTVPTLSADAARKVMWGYVGGQGVKDQILNEGTLVILPVSRPEVTERQPVLPGTGLDYRLVYTVSFRRAGVMGTWEARVDAHTGELLSFLDLNRYGSIKGGVYKTDQPATEASVPFPFADYSGSAWADQAGNFPGTTGTSTMTGRTGTATTVGGVDIVDSCGSISLAANASGIIDFATSSATDCSSPGGGAGNTRASRTQYYNVSMIKIKAYTYLTGNNWLEGRLTDNVNLNQTCNAYWNGSSVNFFRRGSGQCWNTGELPGVSLHEWAHGLDSNDGSPAGDKGTGETYGDFSGTLQTHGSCAGGGFFYTWNRGCGTASVGYNCSGYGDCCTNCSGIREIDYAKHSQNKPYFPEDLTSNTCTGCSTFACSASATYAGPCGREGHCESLVSSQAMWDLPVRDLVTWGMDIDSAWQLMDKLWYASRSTSGSAYACPSVTTANGCGTSNYFTTFRVVDDCDGNLANGTPHASAIFAAFNRHKIACTTVVNTDNDCGCATLTTPTLAGTPGNNTNYLTWGAVSGASSYDVYRNDAGCTAGYTKVGNTTSLNFTDAPVTNGVTYYYRIQANGTGSCPPSPMSNCVTLTPVPCTTPGAPTIGTVTVPGNNQLQVSWTPGSPAGATYRIYRAVLSDAGANCTTGTYAFLATDTASPYVDNTVSGTVTYGYRVTAVDSTGGCESTQSGCAKNTATGTCNMGPVFGGITAVTNPASATCTLNLSWAAATAFCGGPVTYAVYRSTTAPFTPGAGNLLTSGISATSYQDAVGLISGTTYYYIVRATDTANGMQETNTVTLSGAPTGPITTGTWTDDAGDTGTAKLTPSSPWAILTTGGNTGPRVYDTGAYGNNLCSGLETPTLQLGTNSTLTFASRYDIESNWDVGEVQISTNGGSSWTRVPVNYPSANLTNTGNACGLVTGRAYFYGTNNTYANYTASLATWNNQTVKIRWVLSSDTSLNGTGWRVDDISITNVQVPGSCTTGSGCTAPGAPNLTAAAGDCNGVNLTWTAGTGTTLSYNVYRFQGACGGAYTKIAGPVTGTSYSDTTAVAGTSYAYVVRGACDAGGVNESANSNCRTATRAVTPAAPGAPALTPACTSVGLSWTAVSGATDYEVWRNAGANCTGAVQVVSTTAGATIYTDTGRAEGTPYSYYIVAKNATCSSGAGACASTTTLATPAAPGAPVLTPGCTTVGLSWTAVSGATDYEVWRKQGSNCSGATLLASTTGGATTYTDATASGGTQYSYSLKAKNTCGTSGAGACATTTTICVPEIVYQTHGAFTEITGNGNGIMESGEKWSVQVTLTNAGNVAAANVAASLTAMAAGDGIAACNNPGIFGAIGVGGSANYTFEFVVDPARWYGTYPCGTAITFNVVSKSTSTPGCVCADEAGAFASTVGSVGASETATQVTTPLSASGGSAESDLAAAFTIAGPASTAELSYTGNYAAGGGTIYSDDFESGITGWTTTGTVANNNGDTASCASGNNMQLLGTATASRTFSISGYTNLVLRTDWFEDSQLDSGEWFAADYRIDGGGWTNWFTGTDNPTADAWYCAQTLNLPGTGNTLEVRFSINANNTGNEDCRVDNFSVTGTPPASGTWTANARVSLVDPSSTATVLKAYGAVDASPYNVLAYYTGPGIYRIRVEENLGGTATITAGSMTVTATGACATGTASCLNIAPEVSDDSIHRLGAAKNADPAKVDLLFEDVAASGYNLYVSNNPATHDFQVTSTLLGNRQCGITTTGAAGGMVSAAGLTLETGISGPTTALFFLITADNGAGTEGAMGRDSALTDRTADSYCSK